MTARKGILFLFIVLALAACNAQPVEVTRVVTILEEGDPVEVTRVVEVVLPGETIVQELLVTPRGRGEPLTLLYWQFPDHLNPYQAGATPLDPSVLVLEPLARYDEGGILIPWLAEAIPTVENGLLAADGSSITWKLRGDIFWSDGNPLTADDVLFTADFCRNPDNECVQAPLFASVDSVEVVDPLTVTIHFSEPQADPYGPFVGAASPVLQKIQYEECLQDAEKGCDKTNRKPIGTGPYVVSDFNKGETAVFTPNDFFRDPYRPYFGEIAISSAYNATAAASVVLEKGEADFAWNVQVEPQILHQLAQQGLGHVETTYGSCVERLTVNLTNPDPALGELRSVWSAEAPNPHPFLVETAVRQALSLAIDRHALVNQIYGDSAQISCNLIPAPGPFASPNNSGCFSPNITTANALLDEAGLRDLNGDGVRESNGVPLRILLQAATNPTQQAIQSHIQTAWAAIGVATELQNIPAEKLFSTQPDEENSYIHFNADLSLFTDCFAGTNPSDHMQQWTCAEIPTPANQWQGRNVARYCNPAYDELAGQLAAATNRDQQAQLVQQLNDLLVQDGVVIPLVQRGIVSVHANDLIGVRPNTWDSDLWNIGDWVRTIR